MTNKKKNNVKTENTTEAQDAFKAQEAVISPKAAEKLSRLGYAKVGDTFTVDGVEYKVALVEIFE